MTTRSLLEVAPTAPDRSTPDTPPFTESRLLRPGFALQALFVGYPLWWILGVAEFAGLGAAVLMAVDLARLRKIELPRGFVLWSLFLAWVLVGVLLLQVNAPGTVPGVQNTRYVTWAYRLGWYLAATVVLLYVANLRKELSTQRLVRIVGWFYVIVTAGGLLGVLSPSLHVQSLLEIVLPGSIDRIPFIRDLIHPTVAQLYTDAGELNPRPSAPFAYTNDWGLNLASTLPFFLVGWFGKDAGWRRFAGPFVLLASLVPIIQSLNRGMWLGIIAMGLYLMIRAAATGRIRILAAGLAGAAVLGLVVYASPLSTVIENRLSGEAPSNDSRKNLGVESFRTVAKASPVAGFGTTRNFQGSFVSISLGSTAACPLCSPPALGTQGQLWLVMFSQGLVGLLLYLGFLLLHFFRSSRLPSTVATMAGCVLIAHFVTMPFYGAIGPAMLVIMVAVGLIHRETMTVLPGGRVFVHRTAHEARQGLAGRRAHHRVNAAIMVACVLVCATVALLAQVQSGRSAVAQMSVLVPAEPTYIENSGKPQTLDTLAQLAGGSRVQDAVRAAADLGPDTSPPVTVSAVTNTRILNLRVTARSPAAAEAGVRVAADEFIELRARQLQARQSAAVASLETEWGGLRHSLITVDAATGRLLRRIGGTREDLAVLQRERTALMQRQTETDLELARAHSLPLEAGTVVREPSQQRATGGWNVSLASGLLIGVAIGVGIILVRPRRSRHLPSWQSPPQKSPTISPA